MPKTKSHRGLMLSWTPLAWHDYLYWQANDKKILKKINELVKSIQRTPFDGIGRPESLKFDLAGKWSRRISQEHRLVYALHNDGIVIFQCRYHY